MRHPSWKDNWVKAQEIASRFRREEDGAMTYLTISIFVIVMMVGGIGIDAMMAEMRRTQLQDTLDRAVLAAAALDQPLPAATVVQEYLDNPRLSGTIQDIQVTEGIGYKSVLATAETTFNTKFLHWNWNTRMPTSTVDSVSASGEYSPDNPEENGGKVQVTTDFTAEDSTRATTEAITSLTMTATSAAEESIGGVEISLVLDVSGSMNSNNRLPNLKVAAKDFVDTLTNTTEDGKLSISIVPYATQVSAPETFIQHFNLTNEHSYSNCVNFTADDFNSTSIDPTAQLTRTMHFDPWSDSDGRDNDPMELVPYPVCVEASDNTREMLVMQKDSTTLKNFIDDMWGGGNTSLDVGMKWGTALLDQSIQPVIETMVNAGDVHSDFAQRPHAYNSSETLKVVVLMTDGQNTSQYYIKDDFRSGESNIWWNEQEEVYSVYIGEDTGDEDGDGDTTEPMYYWPHTDEWKDHAYGEGSYEETQKVNTGICKSFRRNGSCKRYKKIKKTVTVNEPGSAEVISYADLWARTSIKFNRDEHYYPWMNDSEANNDWYYGVRGYHGTNTKNTRTQAICDAAKEEGIVVFTIGFEAPSGGQSVLKNCASSISHYFDVNGLEISEAFAAIASSIRQLRLTQ
ncbi:TadE/TadG family type IV pilus assembly protein [Cognatishimia activa]|uniref:TadE/TadG family type IV pilus assembly protein n=1 Tax=Cognatishimia activa TaxID=1715691 RepID=UPI00222F70C5|nr:TadE/TadG family type IV pilus assembly protein [Cognatishimia activa]UZD91741.1 pilus assembly protein TadG-related protein [Cognatishimia activa]